MRDADQELHDQVALFLQALTVEAGAAADSGRPLAGLPMGDGPHTMDAPGTPVRIGYGRYPGLREFRVTGLILDEPTSP
ncbi:hypothetical protein [Streptomyces sp. NPDC096012]|uniref:hypothetical protein n=1 Tax=Streptomyces sp. NPDC096012 TaxID=3155684 RepID=UPI00336A421E